VVKMLRKVTKVGKSLAIILPYQLCKVYNWKEGDWVDVEVTYEKITLKRFKV
jgi:antitoxin component of MazEF toxin-antitoxin module